eukprot:CAMPEP_0201868614 /NCGR_PEP_ID=MMETSP0902-20130614/2419_1 /ASSEMBLY_ACC=CAM_ASM_000551 /TAXON_ID=420261 /ORGANISM="Thalassiosira antarctica, Strain CCMP982" /LENGTH=460 /DNA_ID=CAMNT_0048393973 /DNA_START=21 /DNA_END=1403 /DNA_ORIENTATION=-
MAAVAFISPPPNGTLLHPQPPWKSNAVNRSNEFLSASRTALKIAQQHRQRQQGELGGYDRQSSDANALPEWMANLSPLELKLYQQPPPAVYDSHNDDDTLALIQDSQTLLQLLDTHLSELHSLVRRRGHTNDPTLEIQSVIEKFQEGAKEVKDVCDSLRLAGTQPCNSNRSSTQRRKHYELLSLQLESQAKERMDQLKKDLETRSQVLRDQSHRRKLLASGGGAGLGSGVGQGSANSNPMGTRTTQPTRLPPQNKAAVNASSQFQSPLFTATSGGAVGKKNGPSAYSGYAGYGGSSTNGSKGGYAGYGGTTSAPPSFATGMRQRKQQQQPKSHMQIDSGNEDNDYKDKYNKSQDDTTTSVQQQISIRREKRATQSRTHQARLAEKSIAELGVMFTKMSSLVSQQGEILERIEDDVEAAGGDIDAGHDELVKVYGMTKGNRGLILKVFGILIFLIIFMKLY